MEQKYRGEQEVDRKMVRYGTVELLLERRIQFN